MPIKLKNLLEGMYLSQSPSLRQIPQMQCPVCGHSITGSDLEPDAGAQVKLFGTAKWTMCPHCHQPTGDPKDMDWKIKVTTYLYKNNRKEFDALDSEWKKQWLKAIFLTDRPLFRQLAKKR